MTNQFLNSGNSLTTRRAQIRKVVEKSEKMGKKSLGKKSVLVNWYLKMMWKGPLKFSYEKIKKIHG